MSNNFHNGVAPPLLSERADEAMLLSRLKSGDDAAYAELVAKHTGPLLAVARRITRTEADAEDVVQEAFLSAFKAIASFDGRSLLGTWLHRITVNAALMRQRRKASRPEMSIEPLLPQFDNGLHRQRPRPWTAVTSGGPSDIEERELVWKAINQLPEEFRAVVILRDIEGVESKNAANTLGISDSLVRQRLHRGRQALVKLLEPTMIGGES